ncbi:SAM-dependent methyltransferase [Halomonas aestuarii]|uniref:SAM-dependent methyltransferase n=1 Tax=Halomonas aestuarii TaxID=1897729 RepID=UPI000903EF17|nr:class I SAM-dependent methyltransferase [Halomonas aestuarii]
MTENVDLYSSSYSNYSLETYSEIRRETYGEDYGQTSWVSTEESHEIPELLRLTPDSSVLDIGCGSGGYAVGLAKRIGCRVVGFEINAPGVETANSLAESENVTDLVTFELQDASQTLPYENGSFDAIYSTDVMCHVPLRREVLANTHGLLKPGGRFVFSDALVLEGMISIDELETRCPDGQYFFSPPGVNEQLIQESGLKLLEARDTTENCALLSKRWHDAREKRKDALIEYEGRENFLGVQQFLECVHTLTTERRLLRFLYTCSK